MADRALLLIMGVPPLPTYHCRYEALVIVKFLELQGKSKANLMKYSKGDRLSEPSNQMTQARFKASTPIPIKEGGESSPNRK